VQKVLWLLSFVIPLYSISRIEGLKGGNRI